MHCTHGSLQIHTAQHNVISIVVWLCLNTELWRKVAVTDHRCTDDDCNRFCGLLLHVPRALHRPHTALHADPQQVRRLIYVHHIPLPSCSTTEWWDVGLFIRFFCIALWSCLVLHNLMTINKKVN